MQIDCDSCGTTYHVPAGVRALYRREIRCLRCSESLSLTPGHNKPETAQRPVRRGTVLGHASTLAPRVVRDVVVPVSMDDTVSADTRLLGGRYERVHDQEEEEGGQSRVFPAYDTKLRSYVAIKVLKDVGMLDRFYAEAAIGQRLSHPNIARTHDYGCDGDTHFLSMEYLEGETLEQLAARGPLAVERALQLLGSACDALQYVHERGIVHRDVKPANLFVTEQGVLKLVDFGIAKSPEQKLTDPRVIEMGTRGYMAPEQYGAPSLADARSDVWSLAAVGYELVTGRPPFASDEEMADGRRGVAARPAAELRPGLPARLSELLQSALAFDPAERPQSAAAFGERVNALLAPPPTPTRRMLALALIAATVLALLIWLLHREG